MLGIKKWGLHFSFPPKNGGYIFSFSIINNVSVFVLLTMFLQMLDRFSAQVMFIIGSVRTNSNSDYQKKKCLIYRCPLEATVRSVIGFFDSFSLFIFLLYN